MMLDPPSNMNNAYSLVMAEESQRLMGKSALRVASSAKFSDKNDALVFFNGKGKYTQENSGFKPKKTSHLHCDYCNRNGHTSGTCYALHGYPSIWREEDNNP